MKVLCLDGGSSSLKFAAYRAGAAGAAPVRIVTGTGSAIGDADAALERVLEQIEPDDKFLAGVGHRIVFGGPRYAEPARAEDGVLHDLEALVAIEPLHLRAELDLVYAVKRRLPAIPQVLCFDTAFHRAAPSISRRLPLPGHLDPLIERYGFHGLSYEYISSQLGNDSGLTVVAHLGSGASLCALHDRAPVDTTMGFSASGGLMMGTRPGDLDPGIVLRLLGADAYDLERLTDLFYHRSGLLGVSGSTSDMKTLIEKSASDGRAREAVELFVYQLTKHLGAMVAVLGGLETLVFTGGIGEHAPSIRAAVCKAFGYLGVRLDEEANLHDADVISHRGSGATVMVIPTDENLVIAQHTLALLEKIS
jgi:acetate kinase